MALEDGKNNDAGDSEGDALDNTGVKSAAGNTGAKDAAGKAVASVSDKSGPGWGDDWRQRMAGNDDKALKRLERFNSPDDVFRSYRALEQRLSSGELRSALPKDATPEEVTKWRAENGVPEAPDKYDLTFEDGLVVGQEDRPIIDGFLAAAHAGNMTNAQAKDAVQWYYSEVERQQAERDNADKAVAQTSQDALRGKWGNEYRGNMNRVHALLDSGPQGIKEKFLQGRLSDGTPIGSSVEMLEFLSMLERERNPMGTVVPGAGANVASAIDDEIDKIETVMRDNRKKYNADEKMQARYRELLGTREKMQKKAG